MRRRIFTFGLLVDEQMPPRHKPISTAIRLLLVLVVSACVPSYCWGQPKDGDTPPSRANSDATSTKQPREVKPEIFYLPDAEGNLHPVPGFSLEEFRALWNLKEGIDRPVVAPNYSIPRIDMTGTIEGNNAALDVSVQIVSIKDDWVRIPLGLQPAVLKELQTDGEGVQFLQYESEEAGYVAWVRNTQGKPQSFKLKLIVPVSQISKRSRLDLSIPKATTAAKLALRVPGKNIIASVNKGATVLAPQVVNNNETILTAIGLSGRFFLAWQPEVTSTMTNKGGVEAEGEVLINVAHEARVEADVAITLRSLGGVTEKVKLRLPRGFEIAPDSVVGCSTAKVESGDSRVGLKPLVYEAVLDERVSPGAQHVIRFSAVWNLDQKDQKAAKSPTGIEIAGVEVVGALRQSGLLAIAAADNLQIDFASMKNVIQNDQLPSGVDRRGIRGVFRYLGNRPSLRTRFISFEKPIRVSPKHQITVTQNYLRLHSRLIYTTGTANTDLREVHVPGWNIEQVRVKSADLTDVVDVDTSSLEPLMIVFPRSMGNQFEVEIIATQALPVDAIDISAVIPSPVGSIVSDTELSVVLADNVAISDVESLSTGLVREDVSGFSGAFAPRQERLSFRVVDPTKEAVLRAQFDVLPQEILVDVLADVAVRETSMTIRQYFTYEINHEPANQCQIQLPDWLANSDGLTVRVDESNVSRSMLKVLDTEGISDVVIVPLGANRLGQVVVQLAYSMSLSKLQAGQPIPLTVSLAVPADSDIRMTGFRANVIAEGPLWLDLDDVRWTTVEPERTVGEGHSELAVVAENAESELKISTTRIEAKPSEKTIVEKVWVQTWLTRHARQDRAIFKILSAANTVTLHLPPRVDEPAVIVIVDGKKQSPSTMVDGNLRVSFEPRKNSGPALRRHILEVAYRFTAPRGKPGRQTFEPPQIIDSAWTRQSLWQVILPEDEYLLQEPANMSGTSTRFDALWSEAHETMIDEGEAAAWIGGDSYVESNAERFSPRTNQYIFYGVDQPSELKIYSVTRRFILLVGAGLTLILGLGLLQFPQVRRLDLLFLVALAIIVIGIAQPQSAILFGQAAAVGGLLIIVSRLLQVYFSRNKTYEAETVEVFASLSRTVGDSTTSRHPSGMKSPSTTATAIAPVSLGLHSSEVKP